MRAVLAIATSLLLLSGCIEDEPAAAQDVDPDVALPSGPGSPETFSGEGQVTAAAVFFASGGPAVEFSVRDNATLIFAELAWDGPQDLNIALSSPAMDDGAQVRNYDYTHDGGMPGSPDSPHNITLSGGDVTGGAWLANAFGNGAAAAVSWTIAVTVFYGETSVPAGYTAL